MKACTFVLAGDHGANPLRPLRRRRLKIENPPSTSNASSLLPQVLPLPTRYFFLLLPPTRFNTLLIPQITYKLKKKLNDTL
jgi:hypothetical protein